MHRETVELPEAAARALIQAKRDGRASAAVGAASARVIELTAQTGGGEPIAAAGSGDLFIRPGHQFYLDGLLTNFHLPKSSLFMLAGGLSTGRPGAVPLLQLRRRYADHLKRPSGISPKNSWLTDPSPLTEEQRRNGQLHRETVELPEAAARALIQAKRDGRAAAAVGATSTRVIEWATQTGGGEPIAAAGSCDLFIRPRHQFYLGGLLANFHLPKSRLFMLAAALAGTENLRAAYQRAVRERFRFYSYGDAMLII